MDGKWCILRNSAQGGASLKLSRSGSLISRHQKGHGGATVLVLQCLANETAGLPIILLGSYLPGKPRNVLF